MKPYIGQLVHYVPPSFVAVPQLAAFVAKRISEDTAALTVLGPTGQPYGVPKCGYDAKWGADSWHYPDDVQVKEIAPI